MNTPAPPDPASPTSAEPSRIPTRLITAWCVAFVAANISDAPVARWVRNSGTAAAVRHSPWSEWVKMPGAFWFTAAVVVVLWLARRIDWRQAIFVVVVAALSGLNFVLKWIVGRTRPFKLPIPLAAQPQPFQLRPFWHGPWGLFHQVNLSFPSGHECTAFALAAAVWIVWRPAAWALLALAVAVGFERVLENAHYASDVVGAVGFATGSASVARWGMSTFWTRVDRPGPPDFEVVPAASDQL